MSNRKSPLWEKLLVHYRDAIQSGELKSDDRLPSEMEMAAAHNVSRITATRALKELESAGLIRRVKGSGSYVQARIRAESFLHRTATGQAAGQAASNPGLQFISLVVPFSDGFSEDFVHGIEGRAREAGYLLTVHNSGENPTTERDILEDLMRRGTGGIILYPYGLAANMDIYSRLILGGLPVVLIDRRIPGLNLPIVSVDNRIGFEEVVGHLLDQGHRRVMIAGETIDETSSETERYDGYCRAHLSRGIPLPKRHVFTVRLNENETYDEASLRLMSDFTAIPEEERPTAVAAMNDETARFILTAAMARNLKVPEDLAITGFDDLPYAAHLPVPLTTVAQPALEIGRSAAEVLFELIGNPGAELADRAIPSKLVVRESSRASL